MMFDEMIDRNQYPTMKWSPSFLAEHFGNEDAVPMSVADMDLKAPPSVIAALEKRVTHGIYGYEYKAESNLVALGDWYRGRHGWDINQDEIEPCASILNAISILISQHSEDGDGVILQPPVFFEFRTVIRSSNRKLVKNPLKLINGRYQIDFDDLSEKASQPRNKILILCNPHNPVGRVWTEEELREVATICERHNVFVIADEIHGDFTFTPHRYMPFLPISHNGSKNVAVCISLAKTFNISGMVDAITVIPDAAHRQRFRDFSHRYQTNKVNVFASAAIEAAYQDGDGWLDALLIYLQGNVNALKSFLEADIPPVKLVEPEGTFLAWLDFRGLGFDAKELERFLAHEAEVALSPGYWFGREGAGFARMTIGCPRETLRLALDKIASAINKI
jgi:cystathionine beta-lyase